uniref:F-box domain-containing protein n=1 Tax=Meloidogyne hapla TaxID=6305 RepID=A0A1I8B232_MELHA
MYNLPLESKLDIFKHLNINQLTSVRQTNNYFNALIGRYEGELARKDFHFINLGELSRSNYYNDDQFVNIEDGVFELKITSQLMEKYIETSKDYSNITFNEIRFYLMWWDLFNLSERAELIEKSKPYHSFKYTYHLTNIHNPNVKFSIYFIEHIDTIGLFRIERING